MGWISGYYQKAELNQVLITKVFGPESARSSNSFVQNEIGPPESDDPKLAAFRNRSQLIP